MTTMTARDPAVQVRIFRRVLHGFLPGGSWPFGSLVCGSLVCGSLVCGSLVCGCLVAGLLPSGAVFTEDPAGAPPLCAPAPVLEGPAPVAGSGPEAAPRTTPGSSFLSEPGSSGSAGSMPSPRIQIWPGVHQVVRGPEKGVARLLPRCTVISLGTTWRRPGGFTVADISAVHQSRRPHRTHYPEGLPRKHANSPGRRSASPAGSRQTPPPGGSGFRSS